MNIRIAKQSGVGLVEVMVALLIFSVGMLGVASLQVVSKKSSFEAQQRQEAVLLVSDLVARMYSSGLNFDEIKANHGDFEYLSGGANNKPADECNAVSSNCSASDLAAWDRYIWQNAISAIAVKHGAKGGQGLLGAKGCVAFDDANQVISVSISWLSMSDLGGSTANGVCDIDNSDKRQRHVELKTYI